MPVADPTFAMWFTFALIAAAMVLYALESVPIELTSFGLIAVMLVVFQFAPVLDDAGANLLDTEALLAGFANPALITVLAMLVVGQAIVRTRALDRVATIIMWTTRGHWRWTVWLSLLVAAAASAFTNNTPQIVVFIPIMQAVAHRLNLSASKVMMPLNMAVIVGGMPVLIGSSTNLLAAGLYERLGGPPVGLFDIAVVGLVLAVVGFLYAVMVAPRLLPGRANPSDAMRGDSGRQYLTQIAISERSRLAGITPNAGAFAELPDIAVQLIQRGEHAEPPPFTHLTLKPGDVLVVSATRKALTEAVLADPGLVIDLGPERDGGADDAARTPGQSVLAEVMIAPVSRMVGQNLEMLGFRRLYNCLVVGIQRRSRMIRTRITEIRLEPGDVLLIQGHRHDIRALRDNPDMTLLEWSAAELPAPHLARRVGLIFVAMIVAIVFETVPVVTAAVAAAILMVATRCLNVRQAARAIDRRVVCLVGSSIALSAALEATGGSMFVARAVIDALGPTAGPAMVLSVFFLMIALLTNVLSNNSTALLFTPIAVDLAHRLGVDPFIFVATVIWAANCSFATPIGYQTNLLIMTPGHYRFVDYVRAGTPLVVILWIAFSLFAPWYYNLGGFW